MRRVSKILLIDDDDATNFIHKMVIESAECADEIVVMTRAMDALAYLKTEIDGKYPQPNVIFLDINMPGMDGWEFLAEYIQLPETQRSERVVVMLTTSLNPADASRAVSVTVISRFLSKPLTLEALHAVLGD